MEQQPPRRLSLTVSAGQAGETVDTLLRRSLGLSGTVIRRVKWLEDGILLDGVRVHTNRRTAEGQVLSVRVADGSLRSGMVWIKDLHMKPDTLKLIGEKVGKSLEHMDIGKIFQNRIPMDLCSKINNIQMGPHKIAMLL